MSSTEPALDSLLQEDRTFPPPPEFAARAQVSDAEVYARAEADPEAYWAEWAEQLHWSRRWDRVLEWSRRTPSGSSRKLKASHNCLDRHLRGGRGGKTARCWEGEPGDRRTFTYADLHPRSARGQRAARAGGEEGRRVAIYLPMIPEAAIACWPAPASARHIGWCSAASRPTSCATASRDREARVLITADGGIPARRVVASSARPTRRWRRRAAAPPSSTWSSSRAAARAATRWARRR